MSKRTWTAIRIVLALAIVAWLAHAVGIDAVVLQLRHVHVPLIGAALLLMMADSLAKAWNWQQLLDTAVRDRHVPFSRVASWHFAGGFLGAVVPSSASTDAFRALLGQRALGGHGPVCAATVLIVNALGWLVGCAIGILGIVGLAILGELPWRLGPAALLFMSMLIVLPIAYVVLASKRHRVTALLRRHGWAGLRIGIKRFLDAFFIFRRAHGHFPAFAAVSTVGLLAQAGMFALTAAAVGVELPFAVWMVVAPLTRFVALVPISIADLGLIQGAHIYVLALFDVPPSQAFVISALFALQGLFIHATLGSTAFVFGTGRQRSIPPARQRHSH